MQRQLLLRMAVFLFVGLVLSACTLDRKLTRSDNQYLYAKLETPQMCVAFSGGGMRSAAFSVGVLRQLYLQNELARFDLASGASGGSWALFWLDSHAARTPLIEVFGAADGATAPALAQIEQSHFLDGFGRGWEGASGLIRAAGSAQYAELNATFGTPGPIAHYTAPSAVVAAAREKLIPIPVFAATALRSPCDVQHAMSIDQLRKRSVQDQVADFMPMSEFAIEINPRAWGNSFYGYEEDFPYALENIESWAAASGAFIDYPKYEKCKLMRVAGATWGTTVRIKRPAADGGVQKLHLVDGGFADNLAGFPLVRRHCPMTVFIDAEQDEDLQFIGYRRLREGIRIPLGAQLEVPEIDRWIAENPNGRTKAAVDGASRVVAHPVMPGTITYDGGRMAHVLYMKLSMNPERLGDYQANTRDAFETARLCKDKKQTDCSFPHIRTSKTNYSKEEFQAQRELGETMTRLYLVPALREYDSRDTHD